MNDRWVSADSDLGRFVETHSRQSLEAYRAQPSLIEEHYRLEEGVLTGGYSHRQLYELVQNAADALTESGTVGRVRIVLTDDALYCANEGAPIDQGGARAILMAHLSRKGGDQIGHFGLGFKSVLNVTKTPEFFSRSGSFGFSEESARQRISEVTADVSRVPVLRLAYGLDAAKAAAADPILESLMDWATTVVRLPRNAGDSNWLSGEIASFPAAFLLFSRQIRELVLEDRSTSITRKLAVRSKRGSLVLDDGDERSSWRVFRTDVATSALSHDARLDDSRARERESLPVLWAVPLKAGRDKSLFWAFFPTETETTLSGILNAPWKTNADRLNLLEGPYNSALLDALIGMVVANLVTLAEPDDLGRVLDVLPARSRDAKNWADRYISEQLEAKLREAGCIPTTRGTFAVPTQVLLRPEEVVQEPVQKWLSEHEKPERESEWCDRTVEQRERRARAERLGVPKASLSQWLVSIAAARSVGAARSALQLVRAVWPSLPQWNRDQILSAPFVLTEGGDLVAPNDELYLPGPVVASGAAIHFVHKSLAKDPHSRPALDLLRVGPFGGEAELEHLILESRVDWTQVWQLAQSLARDRAVHVLDRHRGTLQLRTLSGTFRTAHDILLPGAIVVRDEEGDEALTVDTDFHPDLTLLHSIGVVSEPMDGWSVGPLNEPWFKAYLASSRALYAKVVDSLPASALQRIDFEESTTLGPLGPLLSLTQRARARMVDHLLPYLIRERPWTLRHATQKNRYKRVAVPGPLHWIIREHGYLYTSHGVRGTKAAVAPALKEWEALLAVASCSSDAARELGLPETLSDLTGSAWQDAMTTCLESDDLETVARLYVAAAQHIPSPIGIRCAVGPQFSGLPPIEVTVVHDRARFDALRSAAIPVVRVPSPEDVEGLVERWGLQRVDARVNIVEEQASEPLLDMFPGLEAWRPDVVANLSVRRCSEVWIEVSGSGGARRFPVAIAKHGSDVCCTHTLSDRDVLIWIANECDLRLTDQALNDIIKASENEARQTLLVRIVAASTPAEKLAVALGEERLKRHLATSVVTSVSEDGVLSAHAAADVALAIYGIEILKEYEAELAEAGLIPPRQWGGSARALDFVEQLGLPSEFAGFEAPHRAPMLDVDGPIQLPPLHSFQDRIAEKISTFVQTPARGLLSLPTGAGKTRVVVEALIRAYSDQRLNGNVIWIAQSDELCEQAVQAWGQAWRALGPNRRLRISRLWGATNNRVRPCDDAHIVVATYQTLINRVHRPDFAWLLKAACVIIDEAHESISSAYTEILSAFGFTPKETPRPLIGLTATPFRGGADETETRWLVNRYGGYRFDHGVMPDDDPYSYLQSMGVLARVEQQLLAGAELSLSELELADLTRFGKLPAAVEERLGLDVARNEILINSIVALPSDWPILLFAASVDHAGLIASHLSLKGVSARAISAETDTGARRFYIDEFKMGRIRVLTNYGVLATGFDAPAIRALYIARPVYSRVAYQQMIGRGLRGPLNGGKEVCRIVNVADNVGQYGEDLAFRHFEHLWAPQVAG